MAGVRVCAQSIRSKMLRCPGKGTSGLSTLASRRPWIVSRVEVLTGRSVRLFGLSWMRNTGRLHLPPSGGLCRSFDGDFP